MSEQSTSLLTVLMKSFQQFLPVLILIFAIAVVLSRLPKVELGHSAAFKKRRLWNWLPLGLTYAFLYMGRYNLTVSKNALGNLMTNADFGTIFFWGTITYGFSFLINGPMTDRMGGKKAILISAIGSSVMNLAMGGVVYFGYTQNLVLVFSVLYAMNMYFQSFGAVAIVKVNSHWFHVRERGTFGGIFGILISLGVYFAYDWGAIIAKNLPIQYVFFIPTAILAVFVLLDTFLIKDTPLQAGLSDFNTGDATSGDTGPSLSALEVGKRMLRNPVIMTIAAIEFCSGFMRNAIMQWYVIFAKQTGQMGAWIPSNWGLILCVAGILGGVFAGTISDKLFQSRRGPVSAVLYGIMTVGGVIALFTYTTPYIGAVVVVMCMAVVGVHGMLSGTASMDFGGSKNVGVAVGLIDGMVYLGTAFQSILLGSILPSGDAAKDPANWTNWPIAMVPVALVGFLFCLKVWNAKPQPKSAALPGNLSASESEASLEAAGLRVGSKSEASLGKTPVIGA
jgi:MFS transporter, OPA family, glycerol-3-phosphate transporter